VIHFQIFFSVSQKKGNHPEAYERTSRMKALYSWERDSLERLYVAEAMERSALKRGKTLCGGSGHANQSRGFDQK